MLPRMLFIGRFLMSGIVSLLLSGGATECIANG
jgi:hypothetical protein